MLDSFLLICFRNYFEREGGSRLIPLTKQISVHAVILYSDIDKNGHSDGVVSFTETKSRYIHGPPKIKRLLIRRKTQRLLHLSSLVLMAPIAAFAPQIGSDG